MKRYDTAKNPYTNKWFVIGYAGFNNRGKAQFIPVMGPYDTQKEAQEASKLQLQRDAAAKRELNI